MIPLLIYKKFFYIILNCNFTIFIFFMYKKKKRIYIFKNLLYLKKKSFYLLMKLKFTFSKN